MWQSFSDDFYKIARKGSVLPIANKLRLLAAALALLLGETLNWVNSNYVEAVLRL